MTSELRRDTDCPPRTLQPEEWRTAEGHAAGCGGVVGMTGGGPLTHAGCQGRYYLGYPEEETERVLPDTRRRLGLQVSASLGI